MAVEIRPIRTEELPRFQENLRVGFTGGVPRHVAPFPLRPEWSLCAFEDGDLATTYAAFPFEMYFNGKVAPAAGVTMVTTQPWHRRRGYLRQIMATDFRRMKDEDGPALALLYASMAAIYQRFGYAIVSTHLGYRVAPGDIRFAQPAEVAGRYRRVPIDEWRTVADTYEAFAAPRTGYFRREPWFWEAESLDRSPDDLVYIITYEEEGAIQGYVVYTAENQQPTELRFGGQTLVYVRDFIWQTPAAYRALWEFLRQIDLAQQIRTFRTPIDDPAPHLLLEPRLLYATQRDGLLARIVDVERALTQRCYAGEGRLTFAIEDELAPWNEGCWELETDGQTSTVCRTERTPELTMPVASLAPLLFGHLTAAQVVRMGRATAHDPAALPRWGALLRTEFAPACGDFF